MKEYLEVRTARVGSEDKINCGVLSLWYVSGSPSLREGGSVGNAPRPARTKWSMLKGIRSVKEYLEVRAAIVGPEDKINCGVLSLRYVSGSLSLREGGSVGNAPRPARTKWSMLKGSRSVKE